MFLTGRAAAVAALGVPAVLLFPSLNTVLAVLAVLLAGLAVDVFTAGRVGDLRLQRTGAGTVRLGESTEVALRLHNGGRRRLRGILRDAWP
ncbi:MAG: DUF58 domain-containing protein, partial [Actinomycetota bacterium]|nr:DUF58 domain-containing protein [Actinomycetota bacterium]